MQHTKASLLEEFNNVIAPQKSGLAARMPALFQQYYNPPTTADLTAAAAQPAANGQLVSKPSQKRPGIDQGPADTKRLKAASVAGADDIEKKQDQLFKEVSNMINKKLWGKKEAYPFKEPVDPVKLKIEDYFTYITHPMDLGTVKQKLAKKGSYRTPMEACEDVRLVFRNCATYNQVGTHVRKFGDLLSDIWEKAWAESRIEDRWLQLQMQKDPTGAATHQTVHLYGQLKSALNAIPANQQPPPSNDPNAPMSDLEKRHLAIQLSELQGEQLSSLIEAVQPDLAPTNPDEEIEIDLDHMPTPVLRKMQAFVNSLTHVRPGVQAPAPHQQQPQQHAPQNPQLMAPQKAADDVHRPQGHLPMQPSVALTEDTAMADSSAGAMSPTGTVDSHEEVKGSTADDPHAKAPVFAYPNSKPQMLGVDESATAPNVQSSILRDKGAAHKVDVQLNAAAWDVNALATNTEDQEQGDDDQEDQDDVWLNFKTKEQQKREQAEEQRKLKEQQEEEMRKKKEAEAAEARRALEEQAARERALAEEEARAQAEQQRQRMEQCGKEVDEIKARQGTANLVQRDDMSSLIVQAQPGEGALAAVGLTYKDDDEDFNFDDE